LSSPENMHFLLPYFQPSPPRLYDPGQFCFRRVSRNLWGAICSGQNSSFLAFFFHVFFGLPPFFEVLLTRLAVSRAVFSCCFFFQPFQFFPRSTRFFSFPSSSPVPPGPFKSPFLSKKVPWDFCSLRLRTFFLSLCLAPLPSLSERLGLVLPFLWPWLAWTATDTEVTECRRSVPLAFGFPPRWTVTDFSWLCDQIFDVESPLRWKIPGLGWWLVQRGGVLARARGGGLHVDYSFA